jgi:hypothetical protein
MTAPTPPFLLFMHIPKNAGTTLRSIVDLQYGPAAVLTYYNQRSRQLLDNLPYVLMDPRAHYRALIGHFSFGAHRNLPSDTRYITFLRDPVRRAISAYNEHVKSDPSRISKPDGSLMSMAEAIAHDPDAYANQQLKMLHGEAIEGMPTNEHLDIVRSHLREHFQFVGTLERFDECILLLSRMLGWQPCLFGQLNRGAPATVDPELRATLDHINRTESTLYAEVETALDEAIAREGALFTEALAELRDALKAHRGDEAVLSADRLPHVRTLLAAGNAISPAA